MGNLALETACSGSPRHVNRLILAKANKPCKINLFTPTCAPRLHRATLEQPHNQREIRADRMLQNLKAFTHVNTSLAGRSLHSSHLGVTCRPNPMRAACSFYRSAQRQDGETQTQARRPRGTALLAGSHLFRGRGFHDELLYESDCTQDNKNICESYRQRTDCGKPSMRPSNKK